MCDCRVASLILGKEGTLKIYLAARTCSVPSSGRNGKHDCESRSPATSSEGLGVPPPRSGLGHRHEEPLVEDSPSVSPLHAVPDPGRSLDEGCRGAAALRRSQGDLLSLRTCCTERSK